MKWYISESKDAFLNLATEEYLTKNEKNDQILFLYQNSPSVIIGKNQNPYTEVGIDYIKEHDIKLVRRLSGGGAVYHDLGNMNYGFIMPGHAENLYKFKEYSQPILDVLNKKFNLGVEFSGRNDLIIDERKISGSAQYVAGDTLLHHGTMLYDVDFTNVSKILLPNIDKLKSKGVKSVQSRIVNMKECFEDGSKVTFKDIIDALIEDIPNDGQYEFTDSQWEEIKIISDNNKKAIEFILENKKEFANQMVEYIPGFGTI